MLFALVPLLAATVNAFDPCRFYGRSNSTSCCAALYDTLGVTASYPHTPTFAAEQTGPGRGYWSLQESELIPTCRVTPANARDAATAVLILSRLNCSFAVRGGGHMSWAGAANMHDGITIDLSAMKTITVAPDNASVTIGAGSRWEEVYPKLATYGLAAAGGRAGPVGVGGFTLGGGKSFFSSKIGFACDNVKRFELVTGQGGVLQVSATSYPDLFKALKGGSNNFGIVTSFEIYTFPQGQMWGGFVIYPATTAVEQYAALSSFIDASGATPDPPGDVQIILAYVRTPVITLIANFYSNTLPTPNPPILANLTLIQPQYQTTLRTDTLAAFAVEVAAGTPNGQRYLFGTLTFGNSAAFFAEVQALSDAHFAPLFAAAAGILGLQTSTVFQPLTMPMLAPGCGANALGLCPAAGNLVILDLTVQWANADADAAVNRAAAGLIAAVAARARQLGILHEYLYLNYAMQGQDPIASYGAASLRELRSVSRKYDPAQVFQKLVPGGFKLYR